MKLKDWILKEGVAFMSMTTILIVTAVIVANLGLSPLSYADIDSCSRGGPSGDIERGLAITTISGIVVPIRSIKVISEGRGGYIIILHSYNVYSITKATFELLKGTGRFN